MLHAVCVFVLCVCVCEFVQPYVQGHFQTEHKEKFMRTMVLESHFSTVNRGDFGQICTILINIFIIMNLIQGFTWGLVKYHIRGD